MLICDDVQVSVGSAHLHTEEASPAPTITTPCKSWAPPPPPWAWLSHPPSSPRSHAPCAQPVDFVVLDHGGIHVLFEAEGKSKPLDSPSVL